MNLRVLLLHFRFYTSILKLTFLQPKSLIMKTFYTLLFTFMFLVSFSQNVQIESNENKYNSLKEVKPNVLKQNSNADVNNFVEKWLPVIVKNDNTNLSSNYVLDGTSYITYYRNFVEFKLNAVSPVQKGKFYQSNNTIKIVTENNNCSNCVSEMLITRNNELDKEFNLLIDNKISYTIITTIIK